MAELVDRVPDKPGRMLITPEDGSPPYYAVVTLADEPVVPGTVVNKQNVLDTVYPLSDNSAVGVIVQTVQPAPDDRWQLCDGAEVSAAAYPELYNQLPLLPVQARSVQTISLDNAPNMRVVNVKYCNGYYVACGYDTSTGAGLVAYTTDPAGVWQVVQLTSGYTSYASIIWDITYADGYYVAVGRKFASSSQKQDSPYVFYTADLAAGWQSIKLPASVSYIANMTICYAAGKFAVACGRSYGALGTSQAAICYADTSDGVWSYYQTGDSSVDLPGVWYSAGRKRYETVYIYTESNKTTTAKLQLMYCADITTGDWQALGAQRAVSCGLSSYTPQILSCYFADANYLMVLVGQRGATSGDYPLGVLLRCDVRTGAWQQVAVTTTTEAPYIAFADNSGRQILLTSGSDYYNIGSGWQSRPAGALPGTTTVNAMLVPANGLCFLPAKDAGEIVQFSGISAKYLPLLPCRDDNGQAHDYIKVK